jgi:hypothetical protein
MNQEELKEYLEKQDAKSRFNRAIIGVIMCFASLSFFAISIMGALRGDNPPSDFDLWISVFFMVLGIGVLTTAAYVTDRNGEGNL